MMEGVKLDVWCKEAICSGASQHNHLCELFIYRLILHILEPNPTRLLFMSHNRGLNHCQEDKFVIVFAFHNTVNKLHPD